MKLRKDVMNSKIKLKEKKLKFQALSRNFLNHRIFFFQSLFFPSTIQIYIKFQNCFFFRQMKRKTVAIDDANRINGRFTRGCLARISFTQLKQIHQEAILSGRGSNFKGLDRERYIRVDSKMKKIKIMHNCLVDFSLK